jgi:hypothetical protein
MPQPPTNIPPGDLRTTEECNITLPGTPPGIGSPTPGTDFLLSQMRNPRLPLGFRIQVAAMLLKILPPEMYAHSSRFENLALDQVTIVIGGIPSPSADVT